MDIFIIITLRDGNLNVVGDGFISKREADDFISRNQVYAQNYDQIEIVNIKAPKAE